MRYLLILLVLLCGCRARKVSNDISRSETKVKTEQSSQVVSKTEITETDKSIEKDSVSDKSETFETDSSTVTADKIVFENGKLKEATGNAKVVSKGNTRKKKDIQYTNSIQANKTKNTETSSDSVGDLSFENTTKVKEKKKETEVKSASWVWIPISIALILAGLIVWYLRKK